MGSVLPPRELSYIQRKTCKSPKHIAMVFDLFIDPTVRLHSFFLRICRRSDTLYARNCERDDSVPNAVLLRQLDALVSERLDLAKVAFEIVGRDV